jgi:hypothetical protein
VRDDVLVPWRVLRQAKTSGYGGQARGATVDDGTSVVRAGEMML